MSELIIASWNVHSGVDGWGRSFDVVAGCRRLDADILVLQETWTSEKRKPLATEVGEALGYRVEERPIARATMFSPPANVGERWGPPVFNGTPHGTRVDRIARRRSRFAPKRLGPASLDDASSDDGAFPRPLGPVGRRRDRRYIVRERGTIGLALLSRTDIPVVKVENWELGQSPRDPTRRAAIAIEIAPPADESAQAKRILVVGVHLSHLRQGSLGQVARLRRMLARRAQEGSGVAAVVAGDMNLPGPAVSAALPRLRRVVRGRTWPAWSPIAQPDHVLVGTGATGTGEVLPVRGSDHLPLRAAVSIT